MLIYKITNLDNNKIYIGKTTKSLEQRFNTHKKNSKYRKSRLYSAMRKYGVDKFIIGLIEDCIDLDTLNDREIYWISALNSTNNEIGYNVARGGNGGVIWENGIHPFKGKQHSNISKLKMKNFRFGKSYEDLYGEERSKLIKEIKSYTYTGKGNPNYNSIDHKELLQLIIDDPTLTTEKLSLVLKVSRPTLSKELKALIGCNNIQIYKNTIGIHLYQKRIKEIYETLYTR